VNQLYYGDNLTIMQQEMGKHSVDLIYLDPPFNSQQNYNLLYRTMTGKPVPEQVEAFCDTWEMDAQKEAIARSMPVLMREHGVDDYYVDFWRLWMQALRTTQPHLLAYLIFMVQRLLHMKSILRPTGSIYLHCDPTASHYIKVMMDGIFGHDNFRAEIIWQRTNARGTTGRWPRLHDVILHYSAGPKFKFFPTKVKADAKKLPHTLVTGPDGNKYQSYELTAPGMTKDGESGRPWRGFDPVSFRRHWANNHRTMDAWDEAGLIHWPGRNGFPRRRAAEPFDPEQRQVTVGDVWTDIDRINQSAKERLGYPTQKPIALLDRIICASSERGDVVFDPFCGCGTTIYSALKNERTWIGCDIAILSIKLIRDVLSEKYRLVEGVHFKVDGIPTSVEGAQQLFDKDPYTFQNWFVERVGGFPMKRKSADGGIDGRVYFETRDGLREMVLQVKGGKTVRPTDVRDLCHVLEREENAEMAGFLSMVPASKAMRDEASRVGTYEYQGTEYPRVQFLTVADVLVDKREFHMPTKVNTKISTGQRSLALPLPPIHA
jgi:DNA modification methylase